MINFILFLAVVLVTNVIQGITGFAGTILAMPFGLMLVGYEVAKPILNVLGIVAGVYVFLGNRKSVNWKELRKIVLVMACGILGGIAVKGLFAGKEQLLYILLGVFVIALSIQGLLGQLRKKEQTQKPENPAASNLLLVSAGIVHGIFVSGGPLLIGYLTKKIQDKVEFRATISTVWIFLNSMIMVDDMRAGLWTGSLAVQLLITLPFFFAGMYIGGKLVKKMSQQLFMQITYVLLFVSGLVLLFK